MNDSLKKLVNIAEDSNMFPEILKSLYSTLKENKEYNAELRKALSLNTKCPVEILEKLAKDELLEIRVNVAKHNKSTEKILQTCAKDSEHTVRYAVVRNANTSEDILISLLKDDNEDVARLARTILKQKL